MIPEENHPPQPRFSAQRCRVKISKFNRERSRRLRLNWQCNRLRLHFIFGHSIDYDYSKTVIDYDYPMSGPNRIATQVSTEEQTNFRSHV